MTNRIASSARLALSALTLCALAVPAQTTAKPVRRPATAPVPQIIPLPLKQIIPVPQRLCNATTPSGLGYRVLRAATGPKPVGDATVTVHYIGYLALGGEVFDQGMDASFPMKGVIPGFSEGLTLMNQGAIVRLCIPARLGYGDKGTGPIPAGADLVFQVELVAAKAG
ncbi:FKBP-type peptidyl-prolyl cis-trans isomerase FkpA [Novosphingobium kunmingense]|uniref:Peptidyl-prolyl cis-trans isomerase n=1 Tax=Novosphingobium kunmingense TaxID=1211806 RepID=A0A2N0I3Z2_9SPHN|nr:FKBP-type peptidyl-prolyl cis-trans isomerase [Novosphingobium kunmingense]PKB25912.1 FKBP-type peptidyl-prolyl cis-trans isomerase FkpA [Novosphingobium kunmingense]